MMAKTNKINKMKKIAVTVALIAANVIAQPYGASAQEGFRVGIEGTPQMSWLMNNDDQKNTSFEEVNTFNGSCGISAGYGFSKNFGVGLYALYSMQGERFKFNGVEQYKKLDYVKIPLMLVYFTEINSNWVFFGKIGPQLDLLMTAKLTDKDGNNIVSDQKNAYANYDIAGAASAGLGLKLTEMLMLDAALSYDYGFTDAENKDYKKNINHPNGAVVTSRAMTYNSTAGLTIGLRYLFK